MKKIIILIMIIFNMINGTYAILDNVENKCNYEPLASSKNNLLICSDNYYINQSVDKKNYLLQKYNIENYKKVPKEEEGLLWLHGTTNNYYKIGKTILIKKIKYNKNIQFNLYEYKYGNHIFYTTNINNNISLYVDGKKILNFKNNNSINSFFKKNNINVFSEIDGKNIINNLNIKLNNNSIKLLNNFLDKKKNKTKLLEKINLLYGKYKDKNDKKSKIIKEILLYLHTEIIINNFKNKSILENI